MNHSLICGFILGNDEPRALLVFAVIDLQLRKWPSTFAVMFLIALAVIGAWTLYNAEWQGVLQGRRRTWFLSLGVYPAWSPPPRPTYDDFLKAFADIPPLKSSVAPIRFTVKWEQMLTEFFLRLWGVSIVFALVSLMPPKHRGLAAHVVRALAIALTAAASTCVVLWIVMGGWGPPMPLSFAFAGLLIGIWLGIKTWAERSTE